MNLDEEAANLIRYQQAYQASGKVLQVAVDAVRHDPGARRKMIRVSTNTIFDQGVFNLQRGQSTLVELQDQISTSRRVRTPADDPVAAARVAGGGAVAGDQRAVHPQRRQRADGAGPERERADLGDAR